MSPVETESYRPAPQAASLGGRTPMTATEARLHLELAYRVVVLSEPQPRTLNLLLAQWALETARGQSMWGYNFGGIKATSRGVMLSTRESYGASERRQIQPFRTYATANLGAKDYIQTLAADFPRAFSELHSGVAERFAQALASEGYFTGNASDYRRSIVLLANEYERKWSSEKLVDKDHRAPSVPVSCAARLPFLPATINETLDLGRVDRAPPFADSI